MPILGVNFGGLGFLTEATLPELYPSLEAALGGAAPVEERLMLRATTMRGGQALPDHLALNDVVITKAARARMTDATVPAGRRFSLGDEDLISNPANPVTGTATVSFERVAPSLLARIQLQVLSNLGRALRHRDVARGAALRPQPSLALIAIAALGAGASPA